MNTHVILIIVQYISVTVLFAEVLVVFSRWKNSIHSYLLLACASSFISNLGYLFELQAGSGEAYVTALKLSYAGRVWIVFAFFLFAAKMCSIRIPKWILAALLTVLPIANGPQVLSMLKGDSDTEHIPVMFLTAHGDRESVLSVVGLSPVDYLLKTIDKQTMIQKLEYFFSKGIKRGKRQ